MSPTPDAQMPDAQLRATVFASSTASTRQSYLDASADMGRRLASAGHVLVYGGGNQGCMGAVAQAMMEAGGRVHGIIHKQFVGSDAVYGEEMKTGVEKMEIVGGSDLSIRKRRLFDEADYLIVLPGGVGTFDELFEAVAGCATQLIAPMPIVLVNTDGFYDGIVAQLDRTERDGLLRRPHSQLLKVVSSPAQAMELIPSLVSNDSRRQRALAATAAELAAQQNTSYARGLVHGAALVLGLAAAAMGTARLVRRS